MKNPIIVASILGMATMPFANATTVGFSGAPSARTVVNSVGATLSSTSLVLVGNFLSETFSLNRSMSVQANFTAIAADGGWKQFSLDTVTGTPNTGVTSSAAISATGKLGGQVTDNNFGATKADYFNGRAVYVWLFNAATIAAATEMGIFKAIPPTSVPWTYPTNSGGVGDSVTLSTISSLANVVPVSGVGSTTSALIQLVPEPSTAFLSALGLIAMASRRRRNRN